MKLTMPNPGGAVNILFSGLCLHSYRPHVRLKRFKLIRRRSTGRQTRNTIAPGALDPATISHALPQSFWT